MNNRTPLLNTNNDGGWPIVAPSALRFSPQAQLPHELTQQEISNIVQQFADAATRAVKAGFDVCEIHAAHGYLIHSFNSPVSNHRNDEYGGSFVNRTRFIRQIVTAVRSVIPNDMPLMARISTEDWVNTAENGDKQDLNSSSKWTIQQSIQLAKDLKTLGVDLIDCSGGGIALEETSKATGSCYMVHYAQALKNEANVHVGAVGGITTAKDANAIIAQGKADLVFMGRHLLYDPYFAQRAAVELGFEKPIADKMWTPQYAWPRKNM